MILGALILGLLTAYYFGLKVGITAAISSALLFFLANVVPGASVFIYGAVAVFTAGVCWMGPRKGNQNNEARSALRRWSRRALSELWRRF